MRLRNWTACWAQSCGCRRGSSLASTCARSRCAGLAWLADVTWITNIALDGIIVAAHRVSGVAVAVAERCQIRTDGDGRPSNLLLETWRRSREPELTSISHPDTLLLGEYLGSPHTMKYLTAHKQACLQSPRKPRPLDKRY